MRNLKTSETVCGQGVRWHPPNEENNISEIVKNCDNNGGSKIFEFGKVAMHLG